MGVLDKKTMEMKVESAQLFNLLPIIPGTHPDSSPGSVHLEIAVALYIMVTFYDGWTNYSMLEIKNTSQFDLIFPGETAVSADKNETKSYREKVSSCILIRLMGKNSFNYLIQGYVLLQY